ncbi:MAG: hypothetical protein E7161_05430 [Firmicutes bacterium]|nr:hypothetical protein [Bacillota bacterium]
MKRDVNDFLEEITTNFSELFVETFLLRYLNEFNKKELLKNINIVKQKLIKKIDNILINIKIDE